LVEIPKFSITQGSSNQFAYTLVASGTISQTDVTDERGTVTRMVFNAAGGLLSVTRAAGLPEQQLSGWSAIR